MTALADALRQLGPIPGPGDDVREGLHLPTGDVSHAASFGAWVEAALFDPASPLHNPDHQTLATFEAEIGWAWVTETRAKAGRRVLGEARLGKPSGDRWQQAYKRRAYLDLFGFEPDFVVTIDAAFVAHALDTGRPADVLAVAEHEVYHLGVERDRFGVERWTDAGRPVWGLRGHDVEEFAGVVRRWGVAASAAGPLAEAVRHVDAHGPEFAAADLAGLCACGSALPTTLP